MKERPILFNAPMVRAILDGTKTQTRRVVKPQPKGRLIGFIHRPLRSMKDPPVLRAWFSQHPTDNTSIEITCPYGQIGDRLWVRETWQTWKEFDRVRPRDMSNQSEIQYPATYDGWNSKKRPPIHMPRWASRITIEITEVRVERLQGISEADAQLEGATPILVPPDGGSQPYKDGFQYLWQSINGPESWDANPWVWVIEFNRVEAEKVVSDDYNRRN